MKTYRIKYLSQSDETATSLRAAERMVRLTAGQARMSYYTATDGLYVWRSKADQARDSDGSRAYAVIESPAQQESR